MGGTPHQEQMNTEPSVAGGATGPGIWTTRPTLLALALILGIWALAALVWPLTGTVVPTAPAPANPQPPAGAMGGQGPPR